MAKNLTDLTARTATADTDLMHINSGGTDYKETKINFLQGNLHLVFANTSTLTSQVDALPAGHYEGICSSYGHQTETGIPVNASVYVTADVYGAANAKIAITLASATQKIYRINKSSSVWSGWSEITGNIFRTEGNIIGGPSGSSIVGRGTATVTIIEKIAIIDFAAKITTAGTSSTMFAWGLRADVIRENLGLSNFVPVSRGKWMSYNASDGTPDISNAGYGQSLTATNDGNFWSFARLYQADGNAYGAWSENHFPVGTYIEGTCYATV